MTRKITAPIPHPINHLTHPQYRPDIDGLRAIAILSVVSFHAFPSWLRGGFVGVDIFFVISGFLISTIIIGSLERNSFSFVEFYIRRVKRIFPALLLVLIACFAFGWVALLADEYKQLGKHIAGGAGFISNFLFWNESGYFDNAAETKPLLHLWSLGVEEQFYIVWPLLLWFAWKWRSNLLLIAIVVGFISFALNVYEVRNDTVAAFYSPQTRFWELMAGSVLAYMTRHRQHIITNKFMLRLDRWLVSVDKGRTPEANNKNFNNFQSLFGAALIAIGFFVITKERLFPGWWALLPIVGSVMIISAGAQAWLNRVVLSNRVLVWFGLISFPLYLWHWPLLSFARIIQGETLSIAVSLVIVLVSIGLAWLTYQLIERPLRFGKKNNLKVISLTLLMLLVGYVGFYTFERDGLSFRDRDKGELEGNIGFDETNKYVDEVHHYRCKTEGSDYVVNGNKLGDNIGCLNSKESGKVDIALMGDSHAGHLFYGLAEQLPQKNILLIAMYGVNGLPYISNVKYKKVLSYLLSSDIKTVIISVYWEDYLSNDIGGKAKEGLLQTVEMLLKNDIKVFIVADVPRFSFSPSGCKNTKFLKAERKCSESSERFYELRRRVMPVLNEAAALSSNVNILDTEKFFCDAKICSMQQEGKEMFADRSHLNIIGSRYVAKRVVQNYPQLRLN